MGMVLGGIFAVIAYRKLAKLRLNFMIISMMFDHMQILSLLAGAKISWPWHIKIILDFLPYLAFDIDVAGPECLARSFLTFERKWYLKVGMPFLFIIFLLFNTGISWLQTVSFRFCTTVCCVSNQKKKLRGVRHEDHVHAVAHLLDEDTRAKASIKVKRKVFKDGVAVHADESTAGTGGASDIVLKEITSKKAIEYALMRQNLASQRQEIMKMEHGRKRDEAMIRWKAQMHKLSQATEAAHRRHNKYECKDRISSLISNFLMVVFCCYIMMTKAAMSIFSCYFPEGDDSGVSYMVSQPSEPCWVDGGLQYALIGPAVLVVLGYSFAYPVSLATLFHKNRETIRRDQLPRAQSKGYDREHNPDYDFRKRWGILYGYFLPSHYWWILVFIGRKFFICAFSVSLRNYPTFQLASTLLVMFFCLQVQIRQRPLMDIHEHCDLIIGRARKQLVYAASLMRHMQIWNSSHNVSANVESKEMKHIRARIKRQEEIIKSYERELENCDSYLWNLNTLEETMSSGAVVLMLSGITFDTTYVKNSPNVRGTIAITMLLILIAMFVYFVSAFVNEIKKSVRVKKSHANRRWRRISDWMNGRRPKKSPFPISASKIAPQSEKDSKKAEPNTKESGKILEPNIIESSQEPKLTTQNSLIVKSDASILRAFGSAREEHKNRVAARRSRANALRKSSKIDRRKSGI